MILRGNTKTIRSALILLGLLPLKVSAQTDSSSVSRQLDSTVISAAVRTSPLSVRGDVRVDIGGLAQLPTVMGTADPLRFVRLLPSVQTGNELDAGIHIQGCDHGHNIVSLDGTPVYGANHLLGLFSVFNPAHFQRMEYGTMAADKGRLGGSLDLIPYREIPQEAVQGDFSLGLVAAQGGLRVRTGDRSMVAASLRRSFLNGLYGRYLTISGAPFSYGFTDANLSWVWLPGSRDKVYADLFFSHDLAAYEAGNLRLLSQFAWRSGAAAVHWDRQCASGFSLRQQVYASLAGFSIGLTSAMVDGGAESHTRNYGYKVSLARERLTLGADVSCYDVLPGQVSLASREEADPSQEGRNQEAADATVRIHWKSEPVLSRWTFSAGCEANGYYSPDRTFFEHLSPSAGLGLDLFRGGMLDLRCGLARQNLFLTGITSLGVPVEFNFLPERDLPPQSARWATLSYHLGFGKGVYAFSAEIYGRRLRNQLEFTGSVLDYIRPGYDVRNMLTGTDGWNYGLNLILHRQSGKLTGWISYALGRSLREDRDGHRWPSDFERIHELNAVATYSARRWDAGGTFTAASGTPYTAPVSSYLMASRLVSLYGERNGARLAPYVRLDLNFNWYFRRDGKMSHGVNISLYNALGRENQVGWMFMYEGAAFAYRPVSFGLAFMPGFGWFCKF